MSAPVELPVRVIVNTPATWFSSAAFGVVAERDTVGCGVVVSDRDGRGRGAEDEPLRVGERDQERLVQLVRAVAVDGDRDRRARLAGGEGDGPGGGEVVGAGARASVGGGPGDRLAAGGGLGERQRQHDLRVCRRRPRGRACRRSRRSAGSAAGSGRRTPGRWCGSGTSRTRLPPPRASDADRAVGDRGVVGEAAERPAPPTDTLTVAPRSVSESVVSAPPTACGRTRRRPSSRGAGRRGR